MKLYLKKKKSLMGSQDYHIEDDRGKEIYDLDASDFISQKIRIRDRKNNLAAEVREEHGLATKYGVYVDGRKVLEVKKGLNPVRDKYKIEGTGWEVRTRLIGDGYEIKDGGRTVAEVKPKQRSSKEFYEIAVDDIREQLQVVGLVVAIEYGLEEIHVDKKDD